MSMAVGPQAHDPNEKPSRGRRILNSTSIYNVEVTQFAVSAADVTLARRPGEISALGGGERAAPPSEEVLASSEHLDTSSMMLIPASPGFMKELHSDTFTVYDDDVFIVTYAKTGTTWITEMVQQLRTSCEPEALKRYKKAMLDCLRIELYAGEGKQLEERMKMMRELSRPRILITHLPVYLLPDKIFNAAKVIITFRNPKDTAVSMYHFGRMNAQMGRFTGDWDTFIKAYINGEVLWGSWIDWHIPAYMRHKDDKNVLMIQFEDMKKDAKSVIEKVADFLNTRKDKEIIEKALDNCGFNKMKKEVGPYMAQLGFFDYNVSHFFRKGIVGDWKNYFTVAQSELYDDILNNVLKHVPNFKIHYE